jgi:AraC-like DNA-binding protein
VAAGIEVPLSPTARLLGVGEDPLMSEDRLHIVFGTGQAGNALAAYPAGQRIAVRAVSRHRPPALARARTGCSRAPGRTCPSEPSGLSPRWSSTSTASNQGRRRNPAMAETTHQVRQGLILHDPVAAESLQDDADSQSKRTLQRRVARATGLTRSTITQIARAEKAIEALGNGLSPQDTALLLGYADQAHLTRSLRRFTGQTPAQVNQGRHWSIDTPIDLRPCGDP